MNKHIILLILLLMPSVGFSAPGVRHSQSVPGSMLLTSCNVFIKMIDGENPTTRVKSYDAGTCFGLVSGLIDAQKFIDYHLKRSGKDPAGFYCVPDGVNSLQGVRIVIKHLNKYPERLHYNSSILITAALRNAFPCK